MRSATIGSILAARRAGTMLARSAAPASAVGLMASEIAIVGRHAEQHPDSAGASTIATAVPAASPPSTGDSAAAQHEANHVATRCAKGGADADLSRPC